MDNFGSWLFDGIGCMMIFDGASPMRGITSKSQCVFAGVFAVEGRS
jgi:hypothetical protein